MNSILRRSPWILLPVMLFSLAARAEEVISSTIYELGSNRQKVLFRMKRTEHAEGDKKFSRAVFTYPDGKVAAIENVVLEGGKLSSFVLDQKQLGEVHQAEYKDGELRFTYTKGEKTKTGSEKPDGNWLVGAQLIPFAQSHWEELMKGQEADFRIVVLERMETIGFKFVKDKERTDADTLVLLMKPTSFLINALVKPLVFRFDMKTKRLLSATGRSTLKLDKDGKWTDFDAETVMSY